MRKQYNWRLLQAEYDTGVSLKELSAKHKMSHMTVKKAAKRAHTKYTAGK